MYLMYSGLFAVIYLLIFCVSLNALIRLLVQPIDLTRRTIYSTKALRLERYYKVLAWAALTIFMFGTVLISFLEVLRQVPS